MLNLYLNKKELGKTKNDPEENTKRTNKTDDVSLQWEFIEITTP